MTAKRALTALGIFLTAAMLLAFPGPAAEGARQGLLLCAEVVIPTLFPFMAVSGFLALSGVGGILAYPLLPLTRYLLRLPDEAAGAVLMSFVGGYPAGAKTLSALRERGQLTPDQAERMLCFCVNAGPGFLVSAVGGVMYRSLKLGWVLLLGQVVSALVVGVVVSLGKSRPKITPRPVDIPMAAAFVEAVTSAAGAMLAACGFIVLFSVMGELLRLMFTGAPRSPLYLLLIGLIEVTKGCAESARLGGPLGLGLTAFFVGFGGLSIMGQVAALLMGSGVRLRLYLLTRPLAGLVSAAVVLPFYPALQPVMAVMGGKGPPIPLPSEGGLVGAACLVAAAAMLMLARPGTPEMMGH